ncbi:hypothetical protein [Paenibacillus pini]|nr:hypothetical protein [Paenibacillus pini]
MKKTNKFKHVVYLLLALAMLLYALPRISFGPGATWTSIFGIVWAVFAFLVIGAHLHHILGVDEEKQKALDRVRQAKLQQWQMKWPEEPERGQGL